MAFGIGFTHYDAPLPDHIGAAGEEIDALLANDAFRFGNRLAGWIEVDDAGAVTDAGHCGRTMMGATTIRLAAREATFAAVEFPVLREVEIGPTWARFVQTSGGHTAVPAPRVIREAPFVAFEAPTVWTTLALTIHADGRAVHEVVGASPFPRHWVYGADGALAAKAGLADFKDWWRNAFGAHTPWGDEESPTLVTEVESALEREMSATIMRAGRRPRVRKVKAGGTLTEQGALDDEVFLLLNGVVQVEVDGEVLAQLGPGAVVGERAVLEGGRRTSTLRAVTAAKVAVASAEDLDRDALELLTSGHRREEV